MDKYQQYIIKDLNIRTNIARQIESKTCKEYDCASGAIAFTFYDNKIHITQNSNYHVHEYELVIKHPTIDEVWVTKKNKKIKGKAVDEYTRTIIIDFDEKSPFLFVSFKDKLTDPIKLPIEYTDANKKEWDEKVRKEKADELAKIVNVKFITGDSLVDVLFKPISKEYHHAIATLYFSCEDEHRNASLQLMGDFKSENGMYYIPICNIGYGKFVATLSQFDKNNKLIYESEKLNFEIRSNHKRVQTYSSL